MTRVVSFKRKRQFFLSQERLNSLLHSPWSGGVVLVIFALVALVLANLPSTRELYHWALESHFSIGFDNFKLDKSIEHWINDGLMAIFFFYVGLEIKRELIAGQLSSFKQASMPIAAALGGMLFPVLIYVLFNAGTPFNTGWGIPMATDIAFAIGVLSLLGNRVPLSLKIFLMALAVVDDLGGILVIAVFYSTHLNLMLLLAAVGVFAFLMMLNYMNVYRMSFYLIPSIILWILVLHSGIHATIAGVLIALTLPSTPRYSKKYFIYKANATTARFIHDDDPNKEVLSNIKQLRTLVQKQHLATNAISPSQRLEYSLHHTVAFFIMPVFALANAGVYLGGFSDSNILSSTQGLGIVLGLVVGKPLGIFLFSWLVAHIGWGELPVGATWKSLFGVACLGGVGFTMSIFIDGLAFTDPAHVASGKIAVLIASLLSGLVSFAFLRTFLKRRF